MASNSGDKKSGSNEKTGSDSSNKSGSGSSGKSGSNQGSSTRGGTSEQHAEAGRQSHKNDDKK
jgi:uncharacterized protein